MPAEYVQPLPQLPGWGGTYCASSSDELAGGQPDLADRVLKSSSKQCPIHLLFALWCGCCLRGSQQARALLQRHAIG